MFEFPVDSTSPKSFSYNRFLPHTTLNPEEQEFCRCALDVEHRRSAQNPYSVCASRIGTTSRQCDYEYNYDGLSDYELESFAHLNNLRIPILPSGALDRRTLISNIKDWVQNRIGEYRISSPRRSQSAYLQQDDDTKLRDKFYRCVQEVSAKGGAYDPRAVCAKTVLGRGVEMRYQ